MASIPSSIFSTTRFDHRAWASRVGPWLGMIQDRAYRIGTARSSPGLRSVVLATAFAPVFAVAYLAAFAIRFDGVVSPAIRALACSTLPPLVCVKLLAFLLTGGHRTSWRRVGVAAAFRMATIGSVAALVTVLLLQGSPPIPRSILVLDWFASLLLLGATRAIARLVFDSFAIQIADGPRQRVLILGTGEAGWTLATAIRATPSLRLQLVGFLETQDASGFRRLGESPVLGQPEDIRTIAERYKARLVLMPDRELIPEAARTFRARCEAAGVEFRVVPGIDALLTGRAILQPTEVNLHDVLCREPVRLDSEQVGAFLRGRVVLVTGAAGSIGSDICRQVLAFRPARLVLLDHNENGLFFLERELIALGGRVVLSPCVASITDPERIRCLFALHRPEVVFHAAAHKHVPMMEANPGEAVKNNVFGTRNLVDESLRACVEAFVMISTDKVVKPTSVMGASMRMAERVVLSRSGLTATRLITVRFGNVLGSNGSVVPLFREQISRGGPVTVTHPEMTRYFMTISEAAQLVLQAGALGQGGEIFVLDMGEPVKVVDLARNMIRLSQTGKTREIDIVFTGLRPGEKLNEELYDAAETRLPTPHPKIYRAKHRPDSAEALRRGLEQLALVVDCPAAEVVVVLKGLLPEYSPFIPKVASDAEEHVVPTAETTPSTNHSAPAGETPRLDLPFTSDPLSNPESAQSGAPPARLPAWNCGRVA